jgi:hypothetical protein
MSTATSSDHRKAAVHDIFLYGTNTWDPEVMTFTDENGPIDFSGATIRMQIKKNAKDASPVSGGDLSLGSGITVSGTSHNIITIVGPTLPPGNYVYDLKVTFAGGAQITYVRGAIVVDLNITP